MKRIRYFMNFSSQFLRREETTNDSSRQSSWISECTWKLIDRKASVRKYGWKQKFRRLKRRVSAALKRDKRQKAENAADEACYLLDGGKLKDAFKALQGWYKGVGIIVLIPKSTPGEFRCIILLDILYKLVSSLINRRISSRVIFDDAIHGFRAGRGTSTAGIEAKLLAQLCTRSDIFFH